MEQGFGSDIHGNAWTGIHGIVVPKGRVRTRMTTREWWLLWQWAKSIIENLDSDSRNDRPRSFIWVLSSQEWPETGMEQGTSKVPLGTTFTVQQVKRTTKLAIVLELGNGILNGCNSITGDDRKQSLPIELVITVRYYPENPCAEESR